MTTRQKTKLRNAFENNVPADIKLSKTHISNKIQYEGCLGSSLSKIAGPLMEVAVPIAKTILAPLGITAAASLVDAGIQTKTHGSGITILIILNEEINETFKTLQDFKDSNTLLKGITKMIENETREQKGGILGMSFGTLGASLLENMLTGEGAGYGNKKEKEY